MRAALVVAALLALGGTVRAQSDDVETRAKALFDEGTGHYNLAEYDEAIASYKDAYRLLPDPLFLFNIAQAYRQKNDCPHARTFYKSYLRNAPDAYNRDKVEKRIVEMEECIRATGAVPESDPADPVAEIVEDPVHPEVAHPDVKPPHEVKPIAVVPIDRNTPPPAHKGGTQRLAGIATASVGAALLAAGGYFSWQAHASAGDVEALCASHCDGTEIQALDDRGHAMQRDAAIAYGVGGIAVAAGAVLYYLGYAAGRESPTLAIAPSSSGATVVGAWSW